MSYTYHSLSVIHSRTHSFAHALIHSRTHSLARLTVPGLPDENGRKQIFNIHTTRMRNMGKLDDGVDLGELAAETKNFSGAEIEGVVRAAQSTALNRMIKVGPARGGGRKR